MAAVVRCEVSEVIYVTTIGRLCVGKTTYHGHFAADLKAPLLVLLVGQDRLICGERNDSS